MLYSSTHQFLYCPIYHTYICFTRWCCGQVKFLMFILDYCSRYKSLLFSKTCSNCLKVWRYCCASISMGYIDPMRITYNVLKWCCRRDARQGVWLYTYYSAFRLRIYTFKRQLTQSNANWGIYLYYWLVELPVLLFLFSIDLSYIVS